jgi:hypothetical protein
MANFVAENGRFFAVFPEGPRREIKLQLDPTHGQNILNVVVADENGVNRAAFTRVKGVDGGQRIAADFPECDPAFVVTDSEGRITNG